MDGKLIQKKIKTIRNKINSLSSYIKLLQSKCLHKWETINSFNDDDGWSNVKVHYYAFQKCIFCEETRTIEEE